MSEGGSLRLLDAVEQLTRAIAERVEADGCVVSRAVGDVLILVAQTTTDGADLNLGQGYLVSEFPATAAVLRTGEPCRLTVDDAEADSREVALLEQLGYRALLMLPLLLGGEKWGLVEAYRRDPRAFTADDVAAASALARIN